jgi:hypothetical protein
MRRSSIAAASARIFSFRHGGRHRRTTAAVHANGLGPVLCVDDSDAAVADHEVVHVRASRAGPPSIVQNGPSLIGQQSQVRGGLWLGLGRGGEVPFPSGGRSQRGFEVPSSRR